MEYYIYLIVMFIGSILGAIMPYLIKKYKSVVLNKQPLTFDVRYLYQTIINAVLIFFASIPMYLAWSPPDILSEVGMLFFAFIFGYGGNAMQIKVYDIYKLWSIIQRSKVE